MDRKAIEASVIYPDVVDRHFDGGYYSPDVLAAWEAIKGLPIEERAQVYKDGFNGAWELAQTLVRSERYDKADESIDLSTEGLGVIGLKATEHDNLKPHYGLLYRDLRVTVKAFRPEHRARLIMLGNTTQPSNPRAFSVMRHLWQTGFAERPPNVKVSVHPQGWNDSLSAWEDGSFFRHLTVPPLEYGAEEYTPEDKEDMLDLDILRLLDWTETLLVAHQAMNTPPDGLEDSGTAELS